MTTVKPLRIHVFGASGSGTSTLGKSLAERLALTYQDVDDVYWKPTQPPFRTKRTIEDRIAILNERLEDERGWVLSGALVNWGGAFVERFTLAVFLYLSPEQRMERLVAREWQRYGDDILPGGSMHKHHQEFLDWAASYDSAEPPIRSLAQHRAWMQELPCPVLELNSALPPEALVQAVLERLQNLTDKE